MGETIISPGSIPPGPVQTHTAIYKDDLCVIGSSPIISVRNIAQLGSAIKYIICV